MHRSLLRSSSVLAVLAICALASGCVVVNPVVGEISAPPTPAVPLESPLPDGVLAPATVILPGGIACVWRDALEVDGHWVAYTCGKTSAGERVLLGEIDGPQDGSWVIGVRHAFLQSAEGKYTLNDLRDLRFTIWQLNLADGSNCSFIGGAAAPGFEEGYPKWECIQGDGPNTIVYGPMIPGGEGSPGVWLAPRGPNPSEASAGPWQPVEHVPVSRFILGFLPSA